MSQYTKSTNFATKDNLSPGDPLKIVRGTEIDTEFNNIATAISTKTDNSAAAITGGSITGITDLAVADGGTGASTATAALNNLLPSQSGNSSKYLQTDGTNATWDAISINTGDITGTLPVANGGTGITSFGTGIATFLGTPSSANLASAVTDETGSGALVFANTPTLVAPILGTPTSGNFSSGSFTWPTFNQNTTGTAAGLSATLAIASGGTGQTTANAAFNALAPSQTSASGKYLKSDGTNTSWDALDISTADITGTLPVANGGTGVTSSTGTGNVVLSNSPTLVTPILGTPQSGNFSTGTFTWPTFNQNTTGTAAGLSATLATTSGGTGLTSFTSGGVVYASSSSALATGSALTFDGTKLTIGSTTANAKFNVNTTSYTAVTNGEQVLIEGTSAWQQGLAFSMWTAGAFNSNYASGYIGVPNTPNELFISGGAAVVNNTASGGWAKALNTTSASFMVVGGGSTTFYGNTGLTANTTYTPTELLRLTSSSLYTASGINVGIGLSNPAFGLTVEKNNGAGYIAAFRSGTGNPYITLQTTGGITQIQGINSAFTDVNNIAMQISGGNVGIGTSSPSTALDVASSNSGITLTNTAVSNKKWRVGGNSAGAFQITESGVADRFTIDTSGNITTYGTISVGNATPSTSGAGITFPATQSASTNANTLDDYEEGDWTPTYFGAAGSAGSLAYSEQTGKYTKIGRQVTITGTIILTNKGSWTGRVQIGGLPFNSTADQYSGQVELRNCTFTSTYVVMEIGRAATTYGRFVTVDGAGANGQLNDTDIANNSGFLFSITYFV